MEVGSDAGFIKTLEVIKSADVVGELDGQIDAAAMQLHIAFTK